MKRVDMEMVLLCAVMAIIGAFGIVAGIAAFMGVSFWECNVTLLVGGGCTIGGILWGSLLIFNSNMVSKRV